jgi:protein-S-isoprenylcysteine O-methyltransferase
MNPRILLVVISILFAIAEVVLALLRRAKRHGARVEDRGSMRTLWLTISGSVAAAFALQHVRSARLSFPNPVGLEIMALVLLATGLAIRWWSIFTLGRLFTVDIAIHESHPIIQSGPYRRIRHPSYAGLILAFFGCGLSFASWLSLAVLMVPITAAVLDRIRKEEAVLRSGLGTRYEEYCARTKRLIPWVI